MLELEVVVEVALGVLVPRSPLSVHRTDSDTSV